MSPRLRGPTTTALVWAGVMTAVTWTRAAPASAHARGIVSDTCDGCHGGGGTSTLALSANPAMFNPGDSVTLTLTITWSSIRVGGAFITTDGVGSLQAIAGEGLAQNGPGLTHTAPKAASGGAVTFRFSWRAPSSPGAVAFRIAALGGNGNNTSGGDAPGSGLFQWVFGCTGRTDFRDSDRDGYGSVTWGTRLACVGDPTMPGYASKDGDCDENDGTVHPGAAEICNGKDDDCNGQIDENAPAVTLWPDADGDGYYKFQSGTSKLGCGNVPGYAAKGGDCVDTDPAIHPGATEICNMKDDNCDGQVDERVRPQCGVGWCARYSPTCDPQDCRPGPPAVETCNLFDDDCDGETDEDSCPTGMACMSGTCAPADPLGMDAGVGVSGSGGVDGGSGVDSGSPSGTGGASGGAIGSLSGSGGVGDPGARPGAASGCAITGARRGDAGDEARGATWLELVLAAGLLSLLRGTRARTARAPATGLVRGADEN